MATATSRVLDAGFVRTSVDTVTTTEVGRYAQSVVLEFSRPMTAMQISTVMDNIKQLDGQPAGEESFENAQQRRYSLPDSL